MFLNREQLIIVFWFGFFLEAKLKQCFINIFEAILNITIFSKTMLTCGVFLMEKKAIRKMFWILLYSFTQTVFFVHFFTMLAEEDACFVLSALKVNQRAYVNYGPGLEQLCWG